jgi:hypothetical protein
MSTEPISPTRNSAALRPRRRWLRFSLRTLLAAMLALGLVLGILSEWVRRSERQRQLVAQLESQRTATIYYDTVYERDADGRLMLGPGFFNDLGDYRDYFHDVWGLDWDGVTEKEHEMLAPTLERLPKLRELSIRTGVPPQAWDSLGRCQVRHASIRYGCAAQVQQPEF